jgi:hypothetical protein
MCVTTSPQLELSFEPHRIMQTVEVRSLSDLGLLYEDLRAAGVGREELAAVAKEAEVSRRRGQFRVAEAGGLTITLHLPAEVR